MCSFLIMALKFFEHIRVLKACEEEANHLDMRAEISDLRVIDPTLNRIGEEVSEYLPVVRVEDQQSHRVMVQALL